MNERGKYYFPTVNKLYGFVVLNSVTKVFHNLFPPYRKLIFLICSVKTFLMEEFRYIIVRYIIVRDKKKKKESV